MKGKLKQILVICIVLAMVIGFFVPVLSNISFAADAYTITISVAEGTHPMEIDGSGKHLSINGQFVDPREANENYTVSITEGVATITITNGMATTLNFNNKDGETGLYSLFDSNNQQINNGTNFTGTTVLTVKNYVEQPNPGPGPGTRTYTLDFHGASYTVGKTTVTASVEGATDYSNVSLQENTTIVLTNFDSETMEVVLSDGQEHGYSTKLEVTNNQTSLANRQRDDQGNLGGIPDGVLHFSVQAKDNEEDEPVNPGQPSQPGGNTSVSMNVTAGEGTYTITKYNPETGKEEKVQKVYDADVNVSINEKTETTVDVTFGTLWINRLYEDIVINGVTYKVSNYIDFDDRTDWLVANHGTQALSFTIPNVTKADNYNIVVKNGENNGKKFMATFLWTADPKQANGHDYIGNAKLEFVKAEYEVAGTKYTVTEKDLEGKLKREGNHKNATSSDGFLSYGVTADVNYDDGSLTLPGGAKVTMRVVPEYGYQVTSVNGGEAFTTTDSGVSEFTVVVGDGEAGYFQATVEKVDNTVTPTSEKVKSGEIELGTNAAKDIKNGTVRLSVEDIELSSDKITHFQEKASEAGDYTISNYLDINLDKVLYRGTAEKVWTEQIHHLTDKALITLQLDDGVDASDIVIVHNIDNGDKFEIIQIESYDPETNTITFYTDSFSNYAIATKGKTAEETNTTENKTEEKIDNVKTGDNIVIYAAVFVIAGVGILFTTKKYAKKHTKRH